MFNLGTLFLFIIGFVYFFIKKKKTKKKAPFIIFLVSIALVYIISSITINELLMKDYLDNIDKGFLEYRTIKEDNLEEFEFKDFPGETEYALIIDYMEGRYRAFYYQINGEEIYQQIGYGLLYYEEDSTPVRRQVSLRYNKFLKLFFFQYKTKTYNIIVGNKEDMKFIN